MTTFNAGSIEANLTLGRSSWTKDLRTTKREIADLEKKSITIGIDIDDTNARIGMDNLELMLDHLDEQTYTPSIDADTAKLNATLDAIDTRLDQLDDRRIVVEVWADTDNAQVSLNNLENDLNVLDTDPVTISIDILTREADVILTELEARLDALERNRIVIQADLDADNALIGIDNLENEIAMVDTQSIDIAVHLDDRKAKDDLIDLMVASQALSLDGIDIRVDVDGYAGAIARMATLEGQIAVLDGQDIDIDVDIDKAALNSLVGAAGGDGSGGHLGLLKILIYAILLLSPILAVAMGALTAAVVAFTAALAGAAGAALVLGGGLAGLVARFKDVDPSDYTPPMQAFADSIDAVKEAWNGFLDDIEGPGFNLMAQGLEIAADVLDTLAPLFNKTADAMSGVLDGIAEFVDSSEYQEMIDFFGGFGVDMLVSFLQIGGNLLRFFGRLFQAIEPFAREMMKGLEDLTAGWMEWADDLENNDAFQQFMENASKYGPMVLDMLGSLLQAFMAIGDALRPFAGPMLEGLIFLFDLIANAPTEMLTALIAGFAGLWLGMSVIAPMIGSIVGGLGALATALGIGMLPLLLIGAAIAGLVATIIYLWETNEEFRVAVIDTWNSIKNAIMPIVEDITALIRDNWGPIKDWAMAIWGDIQSIVVDAMQIIRSTVKAVVFVITHIWENYGEDIIRIVKGMAKVVGSIIKGFFGILKGIFKLIRSVLTGEWGDAWDAIKSIGKAAIDMITGVFKGLTGIWGGVFRIIADVLSRVWSNLWENLKNNFSRFGGWIKDQWGNLIGWFRGLGGKISSAVSNIWDGIVSSFRSAINNVIGLWNNLSFSIDIPDKIPGLPDSYTVSTPNVSYLAKGAYLTEATLAVVGEGADPEIVAPEPVLERIVKDNSGSAIDYGKLAAAVAAAVAAVMQNIGVGLSRDDLYAILSSAGINLKVEATQDVNQLTEAIVGGISFELRRLGFGGVRDV